MNFKEGDKITFKTSSEKHIHGTITKVCHEARIPWDYDVLEKGTGDLWNVFENDITGMWDEYSTKLPYSEMFADQESYDIFKNLPWTYQRKVFNNLFKSDNEPAKVFEPLVKSDIDYSKIDWKSCYPKVNNMYFDPSIVNYLREDMIGTMKFFEEKENKKMKDIPRNHKFVKTNTKERRIKEVMFNGPATIIKWEPSTYDVFVNCNTKGDKTVSVCGKSDIYDKEKGFLLAVIKEFVDNQSYDNILRMMDSFNDEERK